MEICVEVCVFCVSVGMKIGGSVVWKSCLNVFELKKDGIGEV